MPDKEDHRKQTAPKYDVFISHAANDKDFARRVVSELKHRGVSIWFDETELRPGDRWKDKIREAIQESRFFIVILSSNFASSDPWVSNECVAIQETVWKKPNSGICSLRLDDTQPPPFLRKWQSFPCNRDESSVKDLANSIVVFLDPKRFANASGMDVEADLMADLERRFIELKTTLENNPDSNPVQCEEGGEHE